jgi:hypothetical protein
MQPIHRIIEDAPEQVAIPPELRHRRIELIIRPLDEAKVAAPAAPSDLPGTTPSAVNPRGFLIAKVERIAIPSREERNARR